MDRFGEVVDQAGDVLFLATDDRLHDCEWMAAGHITTDCLLDIGDGTSSGWRYSACYVTPLGDKICRLLGISLRFRKSRITHE
ncbi:hypothetical protein M408DRAFT_115611 [Serendipita vermifera MAFF 305830]|uniref:Uncharacterized protein n=1 Tax=Serendipita vermifera MAFF 305830 TaxID=933852 RepID=A0A0C3BDQ4_SERVB|nr:hypothetical protein M408DRAFT_115611 [Serendipita vermifera MAFF 305830]